MSKKPKLKRQKPLSGKQSRYLRGLGHHLPALVILGKDGITDSFLNSINEVLTAHELVKVKLLNTCPLDRIEASEELSNKTGAAVVQILGNTLLLFKENRKRSEDKRIELP
jgi:RNA-binding protein